MKGLLGFQLFRLSAPLLVPVCGVIKQVIRTDKLTGSLSASAFWLPLLVFVDQVKVRSLLIL